MITITKTDLKSWGAFPVGFDRWFNETFPKGEATWEEFASKCHENSWLAWVCYHAALNLPDSQFDPALITALIEIGDATWIAYAACDLSDDRFNPALITALIKTGDAEWLAKTALNLPNSQFDPALITALIETGDAYQIAFAAVYLSDARFNPALIDALIKTGDAGGLAKAAVNLPDDRFNPGLVTALIKTGDAKWLADAACWLSDDRKKLLEGGAKIKTITKTDLESWGAPPGSLKWFNETFPQGEATWEEFASLCPNKRWLAWTCCEATIHLSDDQFNQELIDTLIKTGDVYWVAGLGGTVVLRRPIRPSVKHH